jgi:hypothetical protein
MVHRLKDEDIEKVEELLTNLKSRYANIILQGSKIDKALSNEKSKEYLFHGVLRRFKTIVRCVENIYSIFPLRRETLLDSNELNDIAINLHAFFINIFGLLDNMAWVIVHERARTESIDKKNVGLYSKKTQNYMDCNFKIYLNSNNMKLWHFEYLKNYRDALSHRIPLYVPPKSLNPDQKKEEEILAGKITEAFSKKDFEKMDILQDRLDKNGDPAPFFMHSFHESDQKVVLHAQVITDFGTVHEIIEKFYGMFK